MNVMGPSDPVGFESLTEGRARQRKLASLSSTLSGSAMAGADRQPWVDAFSR